MWVCVCGGVYDDCGSVLVICVLVISVFFIACTVFLYCFVYVQGGSNMTGTDFF